MSINRFIDYVGQNINSKCLSLIIPSLFKRRVGLSSNVTDSYLKKSYQTKQMHVMKFFSDSSGIYIYLYSIISLNLQLFISIIIKETLGRRKYIRAE
ncbi:hypothetical protein BMS3Abin03_00849 [bacterium BMS3Abin03]|nr:hypothetical protein BMS3Abin03_00849 [bacterium BMS3Abin03]